MNTLIIGIVISLPALLFIFGIWVCINWIRYSWIHRNNSRNIDGAQLTREILDDSGMRNTRIKKSILYKKYWNHNKRKDTYRLRHWTYGRKSIWTMTEAAQQAYITTQRKTNKKQFYLFRFPFFLNVIGTLMVIGGAALFAKNLSRSADTISSKAILGIIIMLAGAIISSMAVVIMRFVIFKKVLPVLEKMKFNEFEKRAFRQIYLSFLLYSIVLMIIHLIQLILRVIEYYNDFRK